MQAFTGSYMSKCSMDRCMQNARMATAEVVDSRF